MSEPQPFGVTVNSRQTTTPEVDAERPGVADPTAEPAEPDTTPPPPAPKHRRPPPKK